MKWIACSLAPAPVNVTMPPEEMLPGPEVVEDAELLHAIGNIGTTIFHPVGTCRMGRDATAVVDDALRVHGLGGLRIVDSSIMPTIPSEIPPRRW